MSDPRRGRFCGRPASGKADWARLRERFSWKIPETFNIATACCDVWAAAQPDRVAVTHLGADGARSVWTYGDLKRASDRLAAALAARGVMRGDRVAVLMSQHPAVLVAHLAAMKLGAVSVPLFTLFGSDALRYRLADSGARAVIVESAALDRVMALRPDLPDLQVVITHRGRRPARAGLRRNRGHARARVHPRPHRCRGRRLPDLHLRHHGRSQGRPARAPVPLRPPSVPGTVAGLVPAGGDVGWTPADWAWIGGLMDMALPCLFYGVPLVSHRFAKFDPEAAMRLMAEEGVSVGFIPPTALRMMRHAAVPKGLRLRAIGSGGEALGGTFSTGVVARSAHVRSTNSTARPNATSWSPRSTG
jgi:acetyl-CoA synthetase